MLKSLPALHDVGQIQPAGTVLVFDGTSETVVAASANLEQRITNWTAAEAIGASATDVLGPSIMHDARNASILPSFQRLPELLGVTNLGAQDAQISVHGARENIVVEICDAQPEPSALTLVKDLSRLEDRMQKGRNMAEVLRDTVGLMRIMSGYDQVLALRLRPDGRAEVLGDSRRATLDQVAVGDMPWPLERTGTRVPPYRYVADAQSRPVRVVSNNASPIDLALCQTVMPAPGHIGALAGLGLRSQMILPIVTERALWGALAFQGQRPRLPSPRFTYVCMLVAPLLKEILTSRDSLG